MPEAMATLILNNIIYRIYNIEKEIGKHEPNKRSKHLKKWRPFIEQNT